MSWLQVAVILPVTVSQLPVTILVKNGYFEGLMKICFLFSPLKPSGVIHTKTLPSIHSAFVTNYNV
jgi:hypothetical protein